MCLARVATEHLLKADGESLVRGEEPRPTASASPLSVLIVSENVSPQVNGIARRVTHYIDGLRSLGCDVSVLEPGDEEQAWGHTNPWNLSARMMVIKPRTFGRLVRTHFELVHVVMPLNLSGIWLLAGFRLRRLLSGGATPRLVVSWHCNLADYNSSIFPAQLNKTMELICTYGFMLVPEFADRLLVPTRATEPAFTALGGRRWGLCPTGIDSTAFTADARSTEVGALWAQRKGEALAASGCKTLLLCVGRLSPEKGVHDLLGLLGRWSEYHLWLVGDGPSRAELERLALEPAIAGRVDFWGYQRGPSLWSVYSVCDCFVCPSVTETFGQTVNEALACAVPVVVPRVPAFVEAYRDYIDPELEMWAPGDAEGFARAIGHSLTKRRELGAAPRLKGWEEACAELLDEYHLAEPSARCRKRAWLLFPFYFIFTTMVAAVIYGFASFRVFFSRRQARPRAADRVVMEEGDHPWRRTHAE